MSIIKWFNKPKWQNPNEQVRITAIQTGQDPDLINSLTEIVNSDPSLKVQKAALSRIDDTSSLLSILLSHSDKSIKKQASKKLIHEFSQHSDDSQLGIFKQIDDAETIKSLAQKASNTTVRKAAIKLIKQQGLLSELLFIESEPTLQKLIIEKIEQPATLSRLVQKASKKHADIKSMLQAKLSNHEPQNHNELAIQLCAQLEDVVHGRDQSLDLDKTNSKWNAIEKQVSAANKMRYNGAFAAAKMILDPEHRSQFLKKQKQQRAEALLKDLEEARSKQKAHGLQDINSSINKLQSLEKNELSSSSLERYNLLEQQLSENREKVQKEQHIPSTATDTLDQINQVLNQQIVQPDQLSRFKKQWSKATKNVQHSDALVVITQQFSDACLKLAEKIEQSALLRDQSAVQAIDLIAPTLVQIKEGHLSKAKEMTNQIAALKKTAGFNHPNIKKNKYQLDSVWQQLKDLRNWQKWSNDKARQDIISELKDMIGKAQHPDAVLKKLKDANERWYALEDMEKLPGDKFPSRNQKMWQEFRLVSKALFEPTQPFFEKRSEQQNTYLTDIQTHIEAMNAVDLENASERELASMSRDGIKHLKSLDKLPPKQRGKTAKTLRSAINRIDKQLNTFYQLAESKKLQLIEQAQALIGNDDIQMAIESAKQLQQQWKTAGVVKQHTERKLWKKFRKANDQVFNRRDHEKQQLNETHQNQRKAAQKFLEEHSKQLKKAKDLAALNAVKNNVISGWHELEKPVNLLAHEYSHLLQNIDDSIKQDQFKMVLGEFKNKVKLDALYCQLEQNQINEEEFEKKSQKYINDELSQYFTKRKTDDAAEMILSELLIQGEFITGLETPSQYIEDRMAYQVKILSERMSGEKALSNQHQASNWLDHWFLIEKPFADFTQKNSKRITKVVKAMMELMVE